GERRKRGGPNASPPQEDTKTWRFPAWKAGQFPARLLQGGIHLPLLESSVPLMSREIAVFSPVRSPAAHPQLGPHPIELPNTNQDAEPFLQSGLYHMTRGVRSLTTS